MRIRTYQDLEVWKESMGFVLGIYQVSENFPRHERYGLTAQVRRAAVSVASNIAESEGRFTAGERMQFISQARGSLFEVETQLILARDLGYVSSETADVLLEHSASVGRLINGFATYLRKKRALSRRSTPATGYRPPATQ